MIGELISEFLGGLIIRPLFNAIVVVVWWVVRNTTLIALYPLMLLTGWFRLWLRERGRSGFGLLWRTHGHAGLHKFGWQAGGAGCGVFSCCPSYNIGGWRAGFSRLLDTRSMVLLKS